MKCQQHDIIYGNCTGNDNGTLRRLKLPQKLNETLQD